VVPTKRTSLCRASLRRVLTLACLMTILVAGPVAANPTVKSLKNKKGFTWISKSSANCNYYFEAGTPGERDFQKISDQMEKSRANVEKLLGGSFPGKTESFIVDSNARMKELVGSAGNASPLVP